MYEYVQAAWAGEVRRGLSCDNVMGEVKDAPGFLLILPEKVPVGAMLLQELRLLFG